MSEFGTDPDQKEISGVKIGKAQRALKLAMMPKVLPLPHIRVEELLLMGRSPRLGWGGRPSAQDLDRIRAIAEETDLIDRLGDLVCTLSGGERQRAFFARALAQETELILPDEPTASLDATSGAKFLKLIAARKEEGKTIVLTLHDLNAALTIADRIAVLEGGKKVFEGDVRAFLQSESPARCFGLEAVEATTSRGETLTVFRPGTEAQTAHQSASKDGNGNKNGLSAVRFR